MQDTLLIELRTEELPPKALQELANTFGQGIAQELAALAFRKADSVVSVYATPRRFAVQIQDVSAIQPDQNIIRKGPSVKAGLKDGEPTPALSGFARSCGVEVSQLQTMNDGKQDIYYFESLQKGRALADALVDILPAMVKKLPVPKLMHWSDKPYQFVRPVHGLMMLHGSEVVAGNLFGLESTNETLGHRFLSSGEIVLKQATDYAKALEEQGKVIASFDVRKAYIQSELDRASQKLNSAIVADEDLLNEVTAIVEWPVIVEAGFEPEFLQVPQECLILTMQQNQKYFPLVDSNNKLTNCFLLVSNMQTDKVDNIIRGNERVLRARLSDAAFFFEQDKKQNLESRLPKLNQVVYHNKLGSVGQRVSRLETIAAQIATRMGADVEAAARAARLAKADLVTEMVGEFPELQGIMGKYYALHDGESGVIANAIEQHYQPRFAKDDLPDGDIATAVALADKLEVLVGIWGIGLIPTGDKDPYALRRAALGILRMLMNYPLDVRELLHIAFDTFKDHELSADTCEQVYEFMLTRLGNLLQDNYDLDVVQSVLNTNPAQLDTLIAKLDAVKHFKGLAEAAALAAANKRVQNVLKKNPHDVTTVDRNLLQQDEEKALFAQMEQIMPDVSQSIVRQDFQQALTTLATLKAPVDAFFDKVMVMAEDAGLRANRLNLLEALKHLLNSVADIAVLTE